MRGIWKNPDTNWMWMKDLDKIHLIWWFDLTREPIVACYYSTHLKSGQKWLKNNHLSSFTNVGSKSPIQTVVADRNEASLFVGWKCNVCPFLNVEQDVVGGLLMAIFRPTFFRAHLNQQRLKIKCIFVAVVVAPFQGYSRCCCCCCCCCCCSGKTSS